MSPPVSSESMPAHALHTAEIEQRLGEPLLEGNQADLFEQDAEGLEALLRIVDAAQDHINIDASLLHLAERRTALIDRLEQQCRKGVRVQVLATVAQAAAMFSDFTRLVDAGAVLNEVRPPRGVIGWIRRQYHTVQRQLVVVDGGVAWCGPGLCPDGQNATGPSLRVRGPIVQCLQRWFLETWHASGSHVRLPSADYFPTVAACGALRMAIVLPSDPPRKPDHCVLTGAVDTARHTVFISMAPRVPSRPLVRSVAAAANRGVNVSVLVHGNAARSGPWRRCCGEWQDARAWVYQGDGTRRLPAHCIVDGVWSSMALDGGVGWSSAMVGRVSSLVVIGADFADALEAICQTAVAHATLLDAGALVEPRPLQGVALGSTRMNGLLSPWTHRAPPASGTPGQHIEPPQG